MPTLHIRSFLEGDTDAVIDLWKACGLIRPWNDPRKDIARKLSEQPELFLVGELRAGGAANASEASAWATPPKPTHLPKVPVAADAPDATGQAGEAEGALVASAMVGFDGHRGWLYYLAVAPNQQRRSWGRQLVQRAEALLIERGCPKINLLVRRTNGDVIDFYRTLGYEEDSVVCLGRRLIADT